MKIIEKTEIRSKAATHWPADFDWDNQPTTTQTTLFGRFHWGRGEFGSFFGVSFRGTVYSLETFHP